MSRNQQTVGTGTCSVTTCEGWVKLRVSKLIPPGSGGQMRVFRWFLNYARWRVLVTSEPSYTISPWGATHALRVLSSYNIIVPLGAIFCTGSGVRQENALDVTFGTFVNTIIGISKGLWVSVTVEKMCELVTNERSGCSRSEQKGVSHRSDVFLRWSDSIVHSCPVPGGIQRRFRSGCTMGRTDRMGSQ